MDKEKKEKLIQNGWQFGSFADFLQLSENEKEQINLAIIRKDLKELLIIRYYNLIINVVILNYGNIFDFEIVNNKLFIYYQKNCLTERLMFNIYLNRIEHQYPVPPNMWFCERKFEITDYLSVIKKIWLKKNN